MKTIGGLASSENPDKTAPQEQSDLGLRCLIMLFRTQYFGLRQYVLFHFKDKLKKDITVGFHLGHTEIPIVVKI